MTGTFWLDWALMAVSLTNTILLIWLALTVLLNAERRTWGALLAGTGLLLGGVFFISHTAILGYGLIPSGSGLDFWWRVGLTPVTALPFVWYLMMLWYSGFWDSRTTRLSRRHKHWVIITGIFVTTLMGLLFFENPAPSYSDYANQGLIDTASIVGIPLLIFLYPFYIILCVSLSLDTLQHPGPSERVMGELARTRAQPWLIATSIILLLVSLLVAVVLMWLYRNTYEPGIILRESKTIGLYDLIIESLIGVAVVLLGQAIVAYEIFTGKTLPRRGFLRQWRQAILLAVGYGVVIGFTANTDLRPIYSLLFTTLMMTAFFAMLGWRSYIERERYIDNLRPFVSSQGFFEQLTTPAQAASTELNLQLPFNALCGEVLGTRMAFLIAFGPLAPLVGPPLAYPEEQTVNISGLSDLFNKLSHSVSTNIRITPTEFSNASWAVPLWSERGLIGVLLLGEKFDGGLYTQEEIEIAQTSGERLIDTKASVEIAQRLMTLQRQHLAESQLLDQRARRVLHDDVLQQLHTAMLKLANEKSRPDGGTFEAIELLSDVHNQISDLLRKMPSTSLPDISKLGLIGALRKLVKEEFGTAFESVKWKIGFEAERYTQDISPLMAEVLYYSTREAIRNAAKHGTSEDYIQPLHLIIRIFLKTGLQIQIEDNGKGMRAGWIISEGSGQGLALHSTMMAVVGGELSIESEPGEFTRVSLMLPLGS